MKEKIKLKEKLDIKAKIRDYFSENKASKICALVGMGVVIIAFIIAYCTVGQELLTLVKDTDAFEKWLDGFGKYPQIIFTAVRAFQTVIKIIPAEPLEIASGFIFGTFGGLFYCMLGTLIGSLVIILLTKIFGTKLVSIFVPKSKIDNLSFLQDKSKVYTSLFFIYLIPSTPKDIITFLIGLTDTNIWYFMLITSFARIPSIITSTWCGKEVQNGNYINAIIIFAVTAIVGAVSLTIYNKVSKARENKAAAGEEKLAADGETDDSAEENRSDGAKDEAVGENGSEADNPADDK